MLFEIGCGTRWQPRAGQSASIVGPEQPLPGPTSERAYIATANCPPKEFGLDIFRIEKNVVGPGLDAEMRGDSPAQRGMICQQRAERTLRAIRRQNPRRSAEHRLRGADLALERNGDAMPGRRRRFLRNESQRINCRVEFPRYLRTEICYDVQRS